MATDALALLDAVNAAIAARLSGRPVDSYSINGRNLAFTRLSELYQLRRDLQREVAAGRTDAGTRNYASFGRPS
jgi:hypothetical protein